MRTGDRIFRLSDRAGILLSVAVLHALAIFSQAALAGEFLSGMEGPVRLHEVGGWVVVGFGALQLALSVWWTQIEGPLWIPLSSAAILLGELLQIGTGYGRFPAVHVPLGVLLFGGVVCQAVWLSRVKGKLA